MQRNVFSRKSPKKEAKYYDAERHEIKYILLMGLSALLINLYMECFARLPSGTFEGFIWTSGHPLVFLYNALIVWSTMLIALFFKRRRFVWFIAGLLWFILGTVNGVILQSRMTPFTLYDMQNFADGLTIATTYYSLPQLIGAGVAAILLIAVVVRIFLRSPKWININYMKSIAVAAIGAVLVLVATRAGISTGMLGTFFGNLNYAYRDYGLAYCFAATSLDSGIAVPQAYSEDLIKGILEEKTEKGTDTIPRETDDDMSHPNIIVLQLESFTTAQDYKNIEVSENPTPIFNELCENYTSGTFEVPACGAGTANTEFEVLTGISAKYFGPGEYPYKGKLREETLESLAYIAKSHGYRTSALHNHRALFYNRNEVYKNLGFDTFTSIEYMNNIALTPTRWCKDRILTREIIDVMAESEERDFLHVISVEGHGAYPTTQVFKKPYTEVTADDEEIKWKYEYYLNECHEMDSFVGNLIWNLERIGEPTVMIIYGDHIPALDVKEANYKLKNLYTTRYVIWDNIGLPKEDKDLHSYQSGAELLKAAGIEHEGIIFDYQQSNSPRDPSYLRDMETLAYDMLYGSRYAYGEQSPYAPSDMKMGHRTISIEDIIKIGSRYYIRGNNFTERSIISMDGRQLKTTYMSPDLLALEEEVDPDVVGSLSVSQVDKSEEVILTTVGANEEL